MKQVPHTFRLDSDVLEQLKTIAKKEKRSLNSLVEIALENYVKERNK